MHSGDRRVDPLEVVLDLGVEARVLSLAAAGTPADNPGDVITAWNNSYNQ